MGPSPQAPGTNGVCLTRGVKVGRPGGHVESHHWPCTWQLPQCPQQATECSQDVRPERCRAWGHHKDKLRHPWPRQVALEVCKRGPIGHWYHNMNSTIQTMPKTQLPGSEVRHPARDGTVLRCQGSRLTGTGTLTEMDSSEMPGHQAQ